MSVIKSQVNCLLGKIQQAGPGNKQLAKKRERMLFLDEKMRQEKNSQFIQRIEGIRIVKKGAIKTQQEQQQKNIKIGFLNYFLFQISKFPKRLDYACFDYMLNIQFFFDFVCVHTLASPQFSSPQTHSPISVSLKGFQRFLISAGGGYRASVRLRARSDMPVFYSTW